MSTRHYRVLSVVGARPNLMKCAPVIGQLLERKELFEHLLVHTGQHYDQGMSSVFFEELSLPSPDFSLDVGSGPHAKQTGAVMERLEPVLQDAMPDLVVVAGDVNSTLAAALTAAKLHLPVAHIEAGLRSFDRTMPEEINRVITDSLSDLLFTTSPEAEQNLLAEGVVAERIHFVGNTMIDTLMTMQPHFQDQDVSAKFGVDRRDYIAVTLHRPALVDSDKLGAAMSALNRLSERHKVVFPVHPRTRSRLHEIDFKPADTLKLIEPLGYLDFLGLVSQATGVLTDSGGIQEETTYLGVPCFTLRENTERPITVEVGTNHLLGLDPGKISEIPSLLSDNSRPDPAIPPLWDGQAGVRIVEVIGERRGSNPRPPGPQPGALPN